jgi:translation initiation factor 2 alpha subunit (eIF-2alpha)
MDMHRPAFIPTGIYGDESGLAAFVGDLVAAEELPTESIEIRITHVGVPTHRIAVPDIDLSP